MLEFVACGLNRVWMTVSFRQDMGNNFAPVATIDFEIPIRGHHQMAQTQHCCSAFGEGKISGEAKPDGFEVGRLLAADGEIGRLWYVMLGGDLSPAGGDGLA